MTTIVDVFETALEVPFQPKYVRRLDFSVLKRLANALDPFFDSFVMPPKGDDELRPYLYERYTTTEALNDRFRGASDEGPPGDIFEVLKPYLLYAHGVAFDDGLIYLLDYFRLASSDSSLLREKIPMIENLLKQYAGIEPLLRRQIVIPFSNIKYGVHEHQFVDEPTSKEIAKALRAAGEASEDLAGVLGGIVNQQWHIANFYPNTLDMYFPGKIYIPVFHGLLQSYRERFSSRDTIEPFQVGVLGEIDVMNLKTISVNDVIAIRQEEQFEKFRDFVKGALRKVDQKERYSDLKGEMATAFREEFHEKEAQIRKLTQKSSVFRDLWANKDRIAFGAAIGAAGGAWLAEKNAVLIAGMLGAATTGGPTVYDVIRESISNSADAKARRSLRNHFLAFDPGSSGR